MCSGIKNCEPLERLIVGAEDWRIEAQREVGSEGVVDCGVVAGLPQHSEVLLLLVRLSSLAPASVTVLYM